MIQTLKKKIIVTAMIAVTVLLLVLLGALNAVNAWSTHQDAERLLAWLVQAEADSHRKDLPPEPQGRPDGTAPEAPEGRAEPGSQPGPPEFPDRDDYAGRGGFLSGDLTENDRMAAVYVTVRTKNGEVSSVDVSRISTVSEDDARAMGRTVLAEQKTEGRLDGFRYASAGTAPGERVYVFLHNASSTTAVARVAVLSALAGLGGWLLMLLLVTLLSKKAVAPIAANMERQRQFVTNAGHELKTPLAVIQANTEAMELITGESKWSRNIKGQVLRLTELTGNLLTLARAEETPAAGSFAPVDLSALTERAVQAFKTSMDLRGLQLDAAIEPGLFASGSEPQLYNLLSVLLDNAVKYTDEGGGIRLRLSGKENSLCLRLENDCSSLPDCPPDRLFDRFYRGDASRTQSSGGFGIGLSAARAIALQHRGELKAEYPGEGRIAFTFTLPAAN